VTGLGKNLFAFVVVPRPDEKWVTTEYLGSGRARTSYHAKSAFPR